MKKVLFMISSMNIGGVEKSLLSLLSTMSSDEYEITIYVLEKSGGFLTYLPDWVKVEEAAWYRSVKPVVMQAPLQTVRDYVRAKQFMRVLRFIAMYWLSDRSGNRYLYYRHVFRDVPSHPQEFDLAIAYQGPTDLIDYYIAHKVKAKKRITWVHFDVSRHQMNTKLYTRLYAMFDEINVVSEEARKRLVEKIPGTQEKAKVELNIVPVQLIQEMAEAPVSLDERYKGVKLVTVGRLSEEKGQDLAIEALSLLRRDGYEVRWYCIGEGSYRGICEQLIAQYDLQDDFQLLGNNTNPYPYMRQADIYVQTSRHEGNCLTLAEAKCLGKPIVSTDFIGAFEQLEADHSGYIVECHAEALYQQVKLLIDSVSCRKV